MKKKSIVIIGSSNTDMVIKTSHLPEPGETVIGGEFFMNAGGKGANQAVAASRLGGRVSFIAKLGDDIFGRQALSLFKKEKLDISAVLTDRKKASGIALITVDNKAENCIVVASGANACLLPKDLKKFSNKITAASIVLMQLETPLETIVYASGLAAGKKIITILNPAPACQLPDELFKHISILTPNEKEAAVLTGLRVHDVPTAKQAAIALHKKGVSTVIVTLGAKGALIYDGNKFFMVAAPRVKAIDTTAAGDVFNGALAVALSEDKSILQSVEFACNAAAIAVTRLGAQASAPFRREIKSDFLG
ncbi:MAG: ribokinase [Chitinophagaceae bacterium]|nr:ribokinase [Chitinophagaceae bacterium]